MILEAIYDGHFEHTSHGFRPNRSCHTALLKIQGTFTGVKWFIEGDIKGFFDNIDHNILIEIMSKRINDERFLRLIRKFLNAGYMEDWIYHKTYSGTPQGGIISPILANIYLDQLDKYIKKYADNFTIGNERKRTQEYRKLEVQRGKLVKALKECTDKADKENIIAQIKMIEKERCNTPYSEAIDENYKRLKYVRYADDFLVGIIGSKVDCKVARKI